MILDVVLNVLVAIFLLLGAFFSLAAAIGAVRFPDTLSRVHAGTKPQVFGLACVLVAVLLSTRNWPAAAIMALILVFQALTTPTAAHMIGRAGYRAGKSGDLYVDELEQAVEKATAESGADAVPPPDAESEAERD